MGYGQGGGGDVGGVYSGGGQFFGEGDGDAAGAGADIDDGEAFTGEFGLAAGADFSARPPAIGESYWLSWGLG